MAAPQLQYLVVRILLRQRDADSGQNRPHIRYGAKHAAIHILSNSAPMRRILMRGVKLAATLLPTQKPILIPNWI